MINKYYYLISSLPYLDLNKSVPIDRESFLGECAKWLAPEEYDRLLKTGTDNFDVESGDFAVVKDWKDFDRGLREEMAAVRTEKKASGGAKIPAYLKDVFDEETPLLMETRIQKNRWGFIEEQAVMYDFDINEVAIYFLKLQVLERLAVFDKEKGEESFKELCEVTYE